MSAENIPPTLLVVSDAPPVPTEAGQEVTVINPEAHKVTPEQMEALTRETRRRVTIDIAKLMQKADYSPFNPPFAWDKNDVKCQRYIRMAETVFQWMVNR